MQVSYQVYKQKKRKGIIFSLQRLNPLGYSMYTKGKLSSQKNSQKYKNPNKTIPCKV